jgi:chemotaxis protein MotB
MMAFFLLMWLLGSTTQGDLKGISEYFQSPLRVSLSGGAGSGDATTLIQGGGPSLTHSAGQVRKDDGESRRQPSAQMRREQERTERARMEQLKRKLEAAILESDKLAEYRQQIRIEITPDGLRVTIIDDHRRPMFALGSAVVQPYMREILHAIGQVLNDVESKVALSGHTDATPYSGGERFYSNWELSADRANASRRELHAVGLTDERVMRVLGLAASQPLNLDDSTAAVNRRISISVLTREAQERLSKGLGTEIVGGDGSSAPPARPAWVEPVRPVVPAAAPAAVPTAGRAPGIPG